MTNSFTCPICEKGCGIERLVNVILPINGVELMSVRHATSRSGSTNPGGSRVVGRIISGLNGLLRIGVRWIPESVLGAGKPSQTPSPFRKGR